MQNNLHGHFQKKGIFGIDNYENLFDFTGGIKISKSEFKKSTGHLQDFFAHDGMLVEKGSELHLRGYRYFIALDEIRTTTQKVNILYGNIEKVVGILQSCKLSEYKNGDYLLVIALLDYMKTSFLTLFNAFLLSEKLGDYKLDDGNYQDIRNYSQKLLSDIVELYYSVMIGMNVDDMFCNLQIELQKISNKDSKLYQFRTYIKKNIQSYGFSRPESTHPLLMMATVYNVATVYPMIDTIVSLPSGGTELGYLQKFAYKIIHNSDKDIILLPISLHSIKQLTQQEENLLSDNVDVYIQNNLHKINGKRLYILDDNSSTGKTIQVAYEKISEIGSPRSIVAGVSEADTRRTVIDIDNIKRTHLASTDLYDISSGILPIGRDKIDLKEKYETRYVLEYYQHKLKNSIGNQKIKYSIFLETIAYSTKEKLKNTDKIDVIDYFSRTILSNFYPVKVSYQGVNYPSVEHAYQAQKFDTTILKNIKIEEKDVIQESLKLRGHCVPLPDNIFEVFSDHRFSSGNIKVIANLLQEMGYLNSSWDEYKFDVMLDLLIQKRTQPFFADKLLGTGKKILVEGNDRGDIYWGYSFERGNNFLGRILMYIRDNMLTPLSPQTT